MTGLSGLGCFYKVKKYQGAAELQYDIHGKHKGFMGHPLMLRYGGNYTFSNGAKLHSNINLGQNWILRRKLELPF